IIEGALMRDSKYLWTLPIFHCKSWCYIWGLAAVGGMQICLRKFDPARVWHLIQTEGVTHMSGSPNLYGALLNHPDRPKKMERPVIFGIGGGLPTPSLIAQCQELGARVIHGYGLTETYGPYALCVTQPDWEKLPPREQAKLMGRQGVAAALGDPLRVVDENMRDVR